MVLVGKSFEVLLLVVYGFFFIVWGFVSNCFMSMVYICWLVYVRRYGN